MMISMGKRTVVRCNVDCIFHGSDCSTARRSVYGARLITQFYKLTFILANSLAASNPLMVSRDIHVRPYVVHRVSRMRRTDCARV
jgi:hypothetical protein